jgi:hypothetical protein
VTEPQPPRPIYILKIRSLRSDSIRDLRALLKRLLRPNQWRCLSVELERRPVPPTKGSHP